MPISLDVLIEETDNPLLWETYAAIYASIIGETSPYIEEIFRENPQDPVAIQIRLLDLYESTRDIQYLQAYNEIAIRAQRYNIEGETFPISSTYSKFQAILERERLNLTYLANIRTQALFNTYNPLIKA